MKNNMTTSAISELEEQQVTATFGKWVVLILAIITFGFSIGLPVSMSVMFLEWQEAFMAGRAHTAAIYSTCVGVVFGASIIPGYMMRRFGARSTMLIGSFLATTGFLLSVFVTSVDQLIITTGVIGGLGCCFIQMPCIPCLTMLFNKWRSVIISASTIQCAVVILIFPYVYSFLLEYYSWRSVFGILAGLLLNMAVLSMIITSVVVSPRSVTTAPSCIVDDQSPYQEGYHESSNSLLFKLSVNPSDKNEEEDDTLIQSQTTDQCLVQNERSFLSRVADRIARSNWQFLTYPLYLMFLAHNLLCLSGVFSFSLIIVDLSKNMGYKHSVGYRMVSLTFFFSLFGRVLVAILNFHPRFHSVVLYSIFSALADVFMFILSFDLDYESFCICISLYGMCLGAVLAIQMKCIVDMVDDISYSVALGFCCSLAGIAYIICPVIIGYSVDSSGSYASIIIPIAALGVLTSAILAACFLICKKIERNAF